MELRIQCEPAHLKLVTEIALEQAERFADYDKLGYGWHFGNWIEGPWLFVRRIKNGLSVRQVPHRPNYGDRP